MLVFMGWVLPNQAALSASHSDLAPPDLRFVYSAEELRAVLESMGEAGRAAYIRSRYVFDIVWPLAYTYFYLAVLAWAVPRAWSSESWLQRAWPWLGMGPFWLDMVENTLTGIAAATFPNIAGAVAVAASFFTAAKWSSVGVCSALLLTSVAKAFVRPAK
jgi:hypothetical protein